MKKGWVCLAWKRKGSGTPCCCLSIHKGGL